MKARIIPRSTSKDLNSLNENKNLLTSTFYKTIKLIDCIAEELDIDVVIAEGSTEDYDMIIAGYMGDEINDMDKSKPIYEFYYDSLNGGWFFERYTHNDITFEPMIRDERGNGKLRPIEEIKQATGLSEIFFSPVTKSPVSEVDL